MKVQCMGLSLIIKTWGIYYITYFDGLCVKWIKVGAIWIRDGNA